MYRITLKINFDGARYGMMFLKGVATTDNEKIAQRMRDKGFIVEKMIEPDKQSDLSDIKPAGRPKKKQETKKESLIEEQN